MSRKVKIALILAVVLAGSAAAWSGGAWVIRKVRIMHGAH